MVEVYFVEAVVFVIFIRLENRPSVNFHQPHAIEMIQYLFHQNSAPALFALTRSYELNFREVVVVLLELLVGAPGGDLIVVQQPEVAHFWIGNFAMEFFRMIFLKHTSE